MALLPAHVFGLGALATECVAVCPPANYLAFKLAQLGFHAAMDVLHPAPPTPHAFVSSVPPRWPRAWTAPTPTHEAFLKHVFPWWGPRDDGALGCIAIDAGFSEARKLGFGSRVPVQATVEGVPSLLCALLDPRVSGPNPLLDVKAQHSALTCRVALSLAVALTFDVGQGPQLCRARGATAGSRAIEPLASHDGQALAVWHVGDTNVVLQWDLPDGLRGHVGEWVLRCPVHTAAGPGHLVLFPIHADAGMLHADWATGTLPQQLWELAKVAGLGPSDITTVAVPWLPALVAKSRLPAVEGLVHAQWPSEDMEAGTAVIEGGLLNLTWVWKGETDETKKRSKKGACLALVEGVTLGMLLVLDDAAVCCLLAPGHVLGRTAGRAPTHAPPFSLDSFIPWS